MRLGCPTSHGHQPSLLGSLHTARVSCNAYQNASVLIVLVLDTIISGQNMTRKSLFLNVTHK